MSNATRPMFEFSGPQVIAALETTGELAAIAAVEATFRGSPKVKAALAVYNARTGTTAVVAPVPAPVVAPATTPAPKASRATGIGSKGGDVRWSIASALTKGQGYPERKRLHDALVKASPAGVRQFAASNGLVIAANAVIPAAKAS